MLRTLFWIWNHPLNRNTKIASIIRFIRWQMVQLLMRHDMILPFVNETTLCVSKGMSGATGNWYSGLDESEEMGFVLHYLRSNELFVDVGANIGSYTILASATDAKVISFEPIPKTFQYLCRNILLNELNNKVHAICKGVSSKAGVIRFTKDDGSTNRAVIDSCGSSDNLINVEVVTLDEALEGLMPVLMKIDVEGFEFEVLNGAKKVLALESLQAVIIETNGSGVKYGHEDSEVALIMKSFGFNQFQYDPISRVVHESIEMSSGNTIFIKDFEAAQARVKNAPSFRLVNGKI